MLKPMLKPMRMLAFSSNNAMLRRAMPCHAMLPYQSTPLSVTGKQLAADAMQFQSYK